jgi:uncharacterized protein (DUF433 family)
VTRAKRILAAISPLERITIEAGKCGGRPCIRETRFRVLDLLELLAAGASHEKILADYPFLEREDITAALLYSARQADHVVLLGT